MRFLCAKTPCSFSSTGKKSRFRGSFITADWAAGPKLFTVVQEIELPTRSTRLGINDTSFLIREPMTNRCTFPAAGLTRVEIMKMKQRRRTLKNRGYAASCRTKRIEQKDELEYEKNGILDRISSLRRENAQKTNNISQMSHQFRELVKYAAERKIPLPKELINVEF